MKKILVVFDGLKYADATAEYAMTFATSAEALLTGIFLEDFLYHSFVFLDMVGEAGMTGKRLKSLLDADKKTREKARTRFKESCIDRKISFKIHEDAGFALDDLVKESIYADLLIVGMQETFSHIQELRPTAFIRHLLAGTQCPVLLIPPAFHPIKNAVLLYDGSPSSVFAIKSFNGVSTLKSLSEVTLLYADGNDGKLPDEPLIRELVESEFPGAVYRTIKGTPEQSIPRYLSEKTEGTVAVTGAYQRGAFSRLFEPSLADKLMAELNIPLFIAHF